MTVCIVQHQKQKEKEEMKFCDGYCIDEYNKNPNLCQCFQWMKCKSCPGRRVGTFMMNQMNNPEQFRMMHQPVYPVKISIVNQQHYRERHPEIKPSVLINIPVPGGMFPDGFMS